MTNGEKYKTAQERAEAFVRFCQSFTNCNGCKLACKGAFDPLRYFAWLDLEAEEEKPLPCPFCGSKSFGYQEIMGCKYVAFCECGYTSTCGRTKELAIAAHNRVAKKCQEVKEC